MHVGDSHIEHDCICRGMVAYGPAMRATANMIALVPMTSFLFFVISEGPVCGWRGKSTGLEKKYDHLAREESIFCHNEHVRKALHAHTTCDTKPWPIEVYVIASTSNSEAFSTHIVRTVTRRTNVCVPF